jgi:glucarate dehydratase
MKIVDFRTTCVAIPINAKLRHNRGVHPGRFQRTILELITDEGIVGLGEVGGGDQRKAMEKFRPHLIGLDPFNLNAIRLRLRSGTYFISNALIYAAIEMACLDIMGKALGRPLNALLGGAVRDRVPFIGYVFWRYDRPDGRDDTCAEDVAEHCAELRDTLGVTAMKLKAGVLDPDEEARAMEVCRKRLGAGFGLRIDPNGVWSVPTATRIGRRLEDVGLQFYEDPAWGLTGNAAVRERVRIPIATNMYPARFDDLAPGIRLGAVDIILTDLHYWEGPRGVLDLVSVCRTFGLGVAMHSGTEFGIELAAMIHTAAAIPEMILEADAHYHYLEDDIIVGGKMAYRDGAIAVPTGPGLGVEIDRDKLRHYAAYFDEVGDYYGTWPRDARRPDWVPVTGAL